MPTSLVMACEICKKPFVPPSDDSAFDVSDKPHLCKICGKSFSLKIQLKRHVLSHEANVPYICNTCEKHLEETSSYNLRLSKKGNFECETCNKCFSTKRLLLRHAGEHTIQNILNCDVCGEFFKNMTALKKHAATHKPKKSNFRKEVTEISYQCQECGKNFAKSSQFETHCANHKKYHCSECEVYFASNKLLQEHRNNDCCKSKFQSLSSLDSFNINNISKSDDKKHVCGICNKNFTRKSALEGHLLSHSEENPNSSTEDDSDKDMDFQCNVKDDKTNDMCLSKPKIRKSFSCEKCTLVCPSKLSLKKHMLLHEKNVSNAEEKKPNKKIYTCRVCNEIFDYKDNYKQHKSLHNKERKIHTCQICLKVFSKKKHLKKHIKNHLDDSNINETNLSKNYFEDTSNNTNESNSQDNVKFRISKKEKRAKSFSCGYCGKLFAGETCLKKHEAKHTGDNDDLISKGKKGKKPKILICEFCNEDFTGKRHLFFKHKLSHTPEVCGICDARFTDRASLREHCRIHIGTEEGRRFLECSQRVQDAKNGVPQPEPKVEYIYLVLR